MLLFVTPLPAAVATRPGWGATANGSPRWPRGVLLEPRRGAALPPLLPLPRSPQPPSVRRGLPVSCAATTPPPPPRTRSIVVIGGGAAGYLAAIEAAEAVAAAAPPSAGTPPPPPPVRVTILEATPTPLAKVAASGGGRCNVTHNAALPLAAVAAAYPRGRPALRGPLTAFGPAQAVAWFAARGVALKTEADGRMFPVTDSSATVVAALAAAATSAGVVVRRRCRVTGLAVVGGGGRRR